jgi:hypothetical protein
MSIALTLAGERWITLASTPGFVERNGVRGRAVGRLAAGCRSVATLPGIDV